MKDPLIYLRQFALSEKGHYRGALDGDDGPLTREALATWLDTLDDQPDTFEDIVATWNLRHFTAGELLAKGASNARLRLNTDPPRALWANIKDAAHAADEARHRMGTGIIIASAYRSPAYNKAIGGASKSKHMDFRALDLFPADGRVAKLHATLLQLRQEGYPGAKGIGRYRSFCHIDNFSTRDWRG